MKQTRIRRANESDAQQIAHVHILSWQTIYRGHIPDAILNQLSLEKRTQEWRALLLAGMDIWLIEEDKKLIGFASVCPSRDEDDDPVKVAEISAIYLLPEFWRKGLGRELCQVIFDEVAKKGFKEISLWVLESNKSSRRFYEALEFHATGDIKSDHFGCESLLVIRYRKILGD